MENKTKLSRIDRAIADNIPDITSSFEENAGIVQDFILFILHRMQFDLFGFATFKLSDFTNATGRHRPTLSYLVDRFEKGLEKAPERGGYKFQTVFDFALYEMMQKNLIRSEEHTSELQSRFDLVCRLLLEKKKDNWIYMNRDHDR